MASLGADGNADVEDTSSPDFANLARPTLQLHLEGRGSGHPLVAQKKKGAKV